ncbi:hypothetical protein L6452_06406 [Arctium lappa]|uniref:Uncharacterized protein n=1 Tax=Arctium lappa TaxID=4217 RepID=A0ACB9EIT5_ARCLA|nr:hypothetical protein L6452_06406 [Arctium lappa]
MTRIAYRAESLNRAGQVSCIEDFYFALGMHQFIETVCQLSAVVAKKSGEADAAKLAAKVKFSDTSLAPRKSFVVT